MLLLYCRHLTCCCDITYRPHSKAACKYLFEMPLPEAVLTLGDNPYFGAGFGLFAIGTAAGLLKKSSGYATQVMRRYLITTLEIPVSDHSYSWVLQWIAKRPDMSCHVSVNTAFEQLHSGKISTSFKFMPSPGSHYIWYKKFPIRIERNREKQMVDQSRHVPYETVTLTTLGRNKELFEDILYEARNDAFMERQGMTLVFKPMGHEWRQFGNPQRRRPLHSVILDQGQSERILSDVRHFTLSQEWYTDRGIPYRRGYLLYGPPGCALAGELEYSICVLNIGDWSLSDDRLLSFMASAPPQSIILLEDIDAAFVDRTAIQNDPRYQGMGSITFSGLLNALDGVVSSEARIVFMTTNHIERLDPALLRPGRVDMKEMVGHSTEYQLACMFIRFFPNATDTQAHAFAQNCAKYSQSLNMAQVQAHFMLYKDDPDKALLHCDKISSL